MTLFHRFFTNMRAAKLPVSTREYLTLLKAPEKGAIDQDFESFYAVSRAVLLKNEQDVRLFERLAFMSRRDGG